MTARTYTTADFVEELKNAQIESRKNLTAKIRNAVRFLFNATDTKSTLSPAMKAKVGLE